MGGEPLEKICWKDHFSANTSIAERGSLRKGKVLRKLIQAKPPLAGN